MSMSGYSSNTGENPDFSFLSLTANNKTDLVKQVLCYIIHQLLSTTSQHKKYFSQ